MTAVDLRAVAVQHWTPAADVVAYLPRVTCKECSDKRCQRHERRKCEGCGAFISTAHIHLDYVGHADVRRTLTEIDPAWTWEPLALDGDGLPFVKVRSGTATLWGRLTLGGKAQLCAGTCEDRKADRDKELIGDLIRNGAMAHNVYGSLWSKAERHTELDDEPAPEPDTPAPAPDLHLARFLDLTQELGISERDERAGFVAVTLGRAAKWGDLDVDERALIVAELEACTADDKVIRFDTEGRPYAHADGDELR